MSDPGQQLEALRVRTAEYMEDGMDFDSAMRAAVYELQTGALEDHVMAVQAADVEPECYADCEDQWCPYTH